MIYESKYKNIIKYTFPPNVENPLQFPSTLTFLGGFILLAGLVLVAIGVIIDEMK